MVRGARSAISASQVAHAKAKAAAPSKRGGASTRSAPHAVPAPSGPSPAVATASPAYFLVKGEAESRRCPRTGHDLRFDLPMLLAHSTPEYGPRTSEWDGVRNYAARNRLNEMRVGDRVLFYHSNAGAATGIVGTATVVGEAVPDPSALDPASPYYDSRAVRAAAAGKANPWTMTYLRGDAHWAKPVPRPALLADRRLAGMEMLRLGRLSVSAVTKAEWLAVHDLAGEAP